jgi:hypothetical protein
MNGKNRLFYKMNKTGCCFNHNMSKTRGYFVHEKKFSPILFGAITDQRA